MRAIAVILLAILASPAVAQGAPPGWTSTEINGVRVMGSAHKTPDPPKVIIQEVEVEKPVPVYVPAAQTVTIISPHRLPHYPPRHHRPAQPLNPKPSWERVRP